MRIVFGVAVALSLCVASADAAPFTILTASVVNTSPPATLCAARCSDGDPLNDVFATFTFGNTGGGFPLVPSITSTLASLPIGIEFSDPTMVNDIDLLIGFSFTMTANGVVDPLVPIGEMVFVNNVVSFGFMGGILRTGRGWRDCCSGGSNGIFMTPNPQNAGSGISLLVTRTIGGSQYEPVEVIPAPEPTSLLLIGTGLLLARCRNWRKARPSVRPVA